MLQFRFRISHWTWEAELSAGEGEIPLTVFLKDQKDKNLQEINAKLEKTEFYPTCDCMPVPKPNKAQHGIDM